MKLADAVDMTTTALQTTGRVIQLIGKATDELEGANQLATRMLILQMLVTHTCTSVGAQADQHPRDVLDKLVAMVADKLPEKLIEPPPRTSTRKGPSPWAAVR